MDIRRIVLFAALGLVSYFLWMDWQKDYPSVPTVAENTVTNKTPTAKSSNNYLLPEMSPNTAETNSSTTSQPAIEDHSIKPLKIVHVLTDVLDLQIDLAQGDIIQAQLKEYPESTQKNNPFVLLNNHEDSRYVANSNLFIVQDHAVKPIEAEYTTTQNQYELSAGKNQLVVTLSGQDASGLKISKRFILNRGSYLINVEYDLMNDAQMPWKGYMNTQLLRASPKESKSNLFNVASYTGASYSSPGVHRYQKVSFKDMKKANLDTKVDGGWVAMQQRYFLTAWIPDVNTNNRFYSRAQNNDFTIGMVSPQIEINPAQKQTIHSKLYIGPEVASVLHTISPGLDLTVDYGVLWFISSMIFSLMTMIYSVVGNWGWSIVLVTVLIKLAFYKLSATSYKSMANMRRLQPKLVALRERYADDKAKLSQATMEFYRQEKVNPLGGCLPIVVQIPVFIALYWVLIESVQLRQAPFILWIHDLAIADPYHVLPIIMGITMLAQQRLNPAPPDPMQAKMMMMLPVFFTVLFWGMPAGLVLYWTVNNSLSILQQWYITRKYSDEKSVKKLASSK